MCENPMSKFSTFEEMAECATRMDRTVGEKLDYILSEFAEDGYPPEIAFEILARHVAERLESSKYQISLPKSLQTALRLGAAANQ